MQNSKNNLIVSVSIKFLGAAFALLALSSCEKETVEEKTEDRPNKEEIAEIRRRVKENSARIEKQAEDRLDRMKKRTE